MRFTSPLLLAFLASTTLAREYEQGVMHTFTKLLVEGRADPIISPNSVSGHVHTILGGNKFALGLGDNDLLESTCTTALVKNDKSAYWVPKLYFRDPNHGTFTDVDLLYMEVYYGFDATDDKVQAFPPGLRMFVGDPSNRCIPPATGGQINRDPAAGPTQGISWICPRLDASTPLYPANSDGYSAGIGNPTNAGQGVGFPDANCDGNGSPLRADIFFPQCYNPAAGLDDYRNNMAWASSKNATGGYVNCPEGHIHVPSLHYVVWWNTPAFASQWQPGTGHQPFCLSNGDCCGYSLHADFISGWDVATLEGLINSNCGPHDGTEGLDSCNPSGGIYTDGDPQCTIPPLVNEQIHGVLNQLPGNNPAVQFGSHTGTTAARNNLSSSSDSSPNATQPSAAMQPNSTTASRPSAIDSGTTVVAAAVDASSSSTSVAASSAANHASASTASTSAARPTFPASPVPGWSFTGCYTDSTSNRTLQAVEFADLGAGHVVTTTKCISFCANAGYHIAGTEYGSQCFCDDAIMGSGVNVDDGAPPLGPDGCGDPCEGDATQYCGGSLRLLVYSDTLPSGQLPPTPAPGGKRSAMRRDHRHARHEGRGEGWF